MSRDWLTLVPGLGLIGKSDYVSQGQPPCVADLELLGKALAGASRLGGGVGSQENIGWGKWC